MMLKQRFVRLLIYLLNAAIALLSVYVFLSGGNFIAKLDAIY
jgi:hypothetical protein